MFLIDYQTGNWRLLLFWSALPTFISAILIYLYMFESPRYLLVIKGDYDDAFAVIDRMLSLNS